ncbi:N-lysine methyltransferase KMT5A-B-like [Acipenser oxyrinchus oxyrinchus]|uniref:[histone H4]-lysine(20) N-methyltransferase n=1 Tax=Acipenser oxyrinchus oxyrinchus TaxID=40147 RepID=A0AAD8FX26_ACIOX|nr:N-lysine methyltransferase KMT5A-B-like [Acipenser oxyrinchus oxyrinchus]
MARGKAKTSVPSKGKPEDATRTTEEKRTKENTPEMNRDIILNGQPSIRSFLSPSKSGNTRCPLQDENSTTPSNEARCLGKCAVKNETQKQDQEKKKTVNADAAKFEEKEAKQCNGAVAVIASKTECVAASVHSKADFSTQNSADQSNVKKETPRKVKVKQSARRGAESKGSQNRKVTDYYPIRRSSRKSKKELEFEEKKHIDELITCGIEDGMKVEHIEGKGRGVFATKHFQKGEFVVEYHGDLIEFTDAKKREGMYAQDPTAGCYMYYFQYLTKTYCVDATNETSRLGRLINHSKNGNCQTKLHDINGIPHLILVASRDIEKDEELLYDYGDRSKASLEAHPWLKH